jgi:hypothetical protein
MLHLMTAHRKHFVILCGVLLSLNTSVRAQSQSHESKGPGALSEVGVHKYGQTNKACLVWTDSCVNCSRDGPGETFSCSNIGIACQPKEVECVKHADEKTK